TKDDDEEREICRMGVMDNIDLYTQILKLCTVISRASRNLKKVVEAKFFKFVIQRDKGKEEMFRVYVEKKGEILNRYMVELDGDSMHIIRPPASNTCYMLEDDYYLNQFEILKECPTYGDAFSFLSFPDVPKVIFGGRYVILFRRKEGNTVYDLCYAVIEAAQRKRVVRDTLVDIWFRSGCKEVDIGLGGGRDKPLRQADMLLYSWGI
ncbi:hypothetical protein Tco_1579047, partial [Tanacetum coccineum]